MGKKSAYLLKVDLDDRDGVEPPVAGEVGLVLLPGVPGHVLTIQRPAEHGRGVAAAALAPDPGCFPSTHHQAGLEGDGSLR